MLDAIIRGSLRHRWAVLVAASVLLIAGGALDRTVARRHLPRPDRAHGHRHHRGEGTGARGARAPRHLPGGVGLERGAPASGASARSPGPGIAVVWVEFEWGEDVYLARQVVAERLQTVSLPTRRGAPAPGPDQLDHGRDHLHRPHVRHAFRRWSCGGSPRPSCGGACWRCPESPRSCPIGGDVREYLVELDPAAIVQAGISVEDVVKALEAASAVPAAGFHLDGGQEYLVRGLGRARSTRRPRRRTVLRVRDGRPARGSASSPTVRGRPSPRGAPRPTAASRR